MPLFEQGGHALSLVGDRATKSAVVTPIKQQRSLAEGALGRPGDQTAPAFREEPDWPSRTARRRKGGRFNPDLLKKVEVELKKQSADWQGFVDRAMSFWLGMGAPNLGDWSPAMLLCSGCGSEDINLKTTTTTNAVARSLPGFPSELLEMPNKSRHHPTVLWEYACSSRRGDIPGFEGLNRPPEFWVKANMRTGKHDSIVDRWFVAKGQIEAVRERRIAEVTAREEAQRRIVSESRREYEERHKDKK